MERTVRFTRTNVEWADVTVEVPDDIDPFDIVDVALEKLHKGDTEWTSQDMCGDEWEDYEVLTDEDDDDSDGQAQGEPAPST